MIFYDTPEDIKFLDEFWKNNAGRYNNSFQTKTEKSPKKSPK